jgi:hypothetical protein
MISTVCLYMSVAINTHAHARKDCLGACHKPPAAQAVHIPHTKRTCACTHARTPPSVNQKANKSQITPTQITDVGNAPYCYIRTHSYNLCKRFNIQALSDFKWPLSENKQKIKKRDQLEIWKPSLLCKEPVGFHRRTFMPSTKLLFLYLIPTTYVLFTYDCEQFFIRTHHVWNSCTNVLLTFHVDIIHQYHCQFVSHVLRFDVRSNVANWTLKLVSRALDYSK